MRKSLIKMSDEEDTAILLNSANRCADVPANKKPSEDYQYIPAKNLRKPIPKQSDNLTPLTSGNQHGLVSTVAILAGAAFGCDMGIARPIAPLIKHEFNLSCFERDFIVNIWFAGSLLGGLTGGILIDSFGRRWTMILTMVLLTFGAMLSALANHYILLLVARVICGYSGTVSAVAHCIYMAEVSDSNKRGYNVMLYQLGTATGFLVSVIVAAIKNIDYQWRFSIGMTAVPAMAACIITIIFLQRSPAFLLLKRMTNVSMKVAGGGGSVCGVGTGSGGGGGGGGGGDGDSNGGNGSNNSRSGWSIVMETLVIMAFMLILQQGTGRRQVLYYAPRLFALLGICSNVAEITALISLGIVKVFSTALSLIIVERCGRRTALITSATICMTTVSLLSLLATVDRGDDSLDDVTNIWCKNNAVNTAVTNMNSLKEREHENGVLPIGSPPPFPLLPTPLAVIAAPSPETWTQIKTSCETQDIALSEGLSSGLRILAIVTLLVYEAAYALGLGPVPLLYLAEVFPAAIRGRCVSFGAVAVWTAHIIATESVNKMTKSFTLAGSYLFYSFMCLVAIFYVFLLIPETKGKSLHQVAQELRKISLGTRVYNNLRSLPLICHVKWIRKYKDNAIGGQSTLI